jgi:hypothetical protein
MQRLKLMRSIQVAALRSKSSQHIAGDAAHGTQS